MATSKHFQAWRQRGLFFLILLAFGVSAHFGYAAIHQDRVLFRRAEQHFQAGNPAQAMQLYQAALDMGLQWPQAVIRVVEAALASGDAAAAEQGLNNLLQSNVRPLPPELRNLAGLFDRFGRPELARELLEHYPRQLLANPDLSLYLAGLYRRAEWFRDADLLYQRLLEVPGFQEIAAVELAVTYLAMGRTEDAESLLRAALETAPDNREARIHLARVLTGQGRFHEAIEEYKTVLGDS